MELCEIKEWMVMTEGKGGIARRDHTEWLITEVERLKEEAAATKREAESLKPLNDFHIARLRVLARVAGCEGGVPDDATAMACLGTVLGMIRLNVEQIVAERDRYRVALEKIALDEQSEPWPRRVATKALRPRK